MGQYAHCRRLWLVVLSCAAFASFCLIVPPAFAEGEPPALDLATVSEKADEAAIAGHNAWMLTCCALVLFMTAPGLALFYGGLVRKKNVLSVMMQCLFLMGLMTVLWALYGYSFAFGGDGLYFGNFEYVFMQGVQRTWDVEAGAVIEPMYSVSLPMLTHMLFQGMFFIITPALICGAFAERMKFSAMVVFSVLWGTFVYCPPVPLGVGWRDPRFQYDRSDKSWYSHFLGGRRARLCWRDRGPY